MSGTSSVGSIGPQLQNHSQKLKKQEEIPLLSPSLLFSFLIFPPFPLEVGPLHRFRLKGLGERSSSPSGSGQSPAAKRISALENASTGSYIVIVLHVVSPVI